MNAIRTLILDYGEVLCRPQRAGTMAALADVLGSDEAGVRQAYWGLRRQYDEGLTVAEYWRRVAEAAGVPSLADDTRDRLVEIDIASWTDYREEVWDITREFRAGGGRAAFLSNGVPEIMARIRADRAPETVFDAVVVSCEVGLTKPHPAIYRHVLERLDTAPGDALFVDDRRENTDAAAALGIRTLVFTGDESVAALRALLGLR